MFVVTHRKLFFWITGLILGAAVASIAFFGLPLGIDFTGGSLMQVRFEERPALALIEERVAEVQLGAVSVRALDEDAVAIRSRSMTPDERAAVLATLSSFAGAEELSFTSVGPSLGSEFTDKALWAILAVVVGIVLYIAFAFRRVSRPVPSWGYGLVVVAMLAIDIIVPTGFFAAYANFTGAEVDSLFIVALLALLGYCVNDIIVVFDRIREHLAKNEHQGIQEAFELTVGKSIDETMARSINTALTVVFVLVALIVVGAPATRDFSIVMLVGILAGAFSSICRSAPLLIPLARWFAR